MTEAQAEALDAVHFTAAANCLTITPQRGDMLFVNNMAIMHSRKSFRDSSQAKRYILRLWLYNPELGWQVPPGLQVAWDRIFDELEEIRDYWDIDPYDAREGSLYGKVKTSEDEDRGREIGGNNYGVSTSCG